IYHQYYEEPRYRPSPITAQRLAAGVPGRKSGRGFYADAHGKAQTIVEERAPPARPARVSVSRPPLRVKLGGLLAKVGAPMDPNPRPAAQSLCLVAPLGQDATTTALEEGLDPRRTLAVDCLFPAGRRRTLMTTPVTSPTMREAAHGLLASDGVP